MRRRDFCGGLAVLAGLRGQTAPAAEALTLAYNALSPVVWPVLIAEQTGCYAKYGLDVKPVLAADPVWVALLARGEAAMGIGGLQQLLPAAANDGSLVAIGAPMNKSTLRLVARQDIATVAALKGKRIAVGVTGDALYGFVMALLKKFGLSSSEVELIPVGSSSARRAAALTGGRADATLLTAEASLQLDETRYRVLADLAGDGDIVTSIGYWVRKAEVSSGRRTLERLMQAQTEAVAKFYQDKAAAIQAYLAHDKQSSAARLARVYDLMAANNVFERVPYVLKRAVAAVDQQTGRGSEVAADFRPAVDNSIVDGLARQGFFVKLFGPGIETEQERAAGLAYR